MRVRYSRKEQPAECSATAGGPRRALPIIGQEAADVPDRQRRHALTDVDCRRSSHAHQASDALVTLALVPNDQPATNMMAGVVVDAGSRVTVRAPGRGVRREPCHFVGVQAVEPSAFAAVPDNTPANSVGDATTGSSRGVQARFAGFVTRAAFLGRRHDCRLLGTLPPRSAGRRRRAGTPASIPPARVETSILWDDVEIGGHAVLEECIVTDGTVVPDGARYRRAVLRGGASAQLRSHSIEHYRGPRTGRTCGHGSIAISDASGLARPAGRRLCRSPEMPPIAATFASCSTTVNRWSWPARRADRASPRCRSRTSPRLLHNVPLPVPRILGHLNDAGCDRPGDLGDVTLQAHLGARRREPSTRRSTGRPWRIVDSCSGAAPSLRQTATLPYGIAFDVEKLSVGAATSSRSISSRRYRGATLSAESEREALSTEWAQIATELAAEARVLCQWD